MADISVKTTNESEDGFTFDVAVSDAGSTSHHVVTVSRDDFDSQADRFSSAEEFVERCFDFLLQRESKESILARFDVRDIGTYFPEFNGDVLRSKD